MRIASKQRFATARILVRAPNWLGDVVMSIPGLALLRASVPESHIVVQLPEPLRPLLDGSPVCDEVWPIAARRGGLRGWRADARRVSEVPFDLGIVIPESISSALSMRVGGVREIVGFARDPLRRALLNRTLRAPRAWGRRRLVSRERFVATLVAGALEDALDLEKTDLVPRLRVSAADEGRLDTILASHGIEGATRNGNRLVVIAPGASFGPSKCWPVESYAELGDRLSARGLDVCLVGAPGEEGRIAAVGRTMSSDPISLAGVLDLGSLKALVGRARALVANDAGARHIATALGVPSVIFFGPTSVAKTADNLERVAVLEDEHACRPCYRRHCPIDHRCLKSIEVARAEAALIRQIEVS